MYLKKEVLPLFYDWVSTFPKLVSMDDAKKYGMFFVANNIDPNKVESRGEVYKLFEDVKTYGEVQKSMFARQMKQDEMLRLENLCTVARGVIWAIEHDALDSIKYDPIDSWGMDILKVGKEYSM